MQEKPTEAVPRQHAFGWLTWTQGIARELALMSFYIVNLYFVQKKLAYTSPATTANMYADIFFEDMQEGLTELYDG